MTVTIKRLVVDCRLEREHFLLGIFSRLDIYMHCIVKVVGALPVFNFSRNSEPNFYPSLIYDGLKICRKGGDVPFDFVWMGGVLEGPRGPWKARKTRWKTRRKARKALGRPGRPARRPGRPSEDPSEDPEDPKKYK